MHTMYYVTTYVHYQCHERMRMHCMHCACSCTCAFARSLSQRKEGTEFLSLPQAKGNTACACLAASALKQPTVPAGSVARPRCCLSHDQVNSCVLTQELDPHPAPRSRDSGRRLVKPSAALAVAQVGRRARPGGWYGTQVRRPRRPPWGVKGR